jgi:molybdopterin-guanine dinucleotide biosynthesis protein B
MKIIGVVGWKDTGKTTLIEKLIKEFNKRNLMVSTIKHSHHTVSLDRQGTDSFRHFNAGAKETILASDTKWIKFSKPISEYENSLDYLIKQIIPVDLVIV